MKAYSSKEIQNTVGVTRGQFNHWIIQGFIKPFQDVCGRGKSRVFNENNLLETLLCKYLTKAIYGAKTWSGALSLIRNEDFQDYAFLVWDQGLWRLITERGLANGIGQNPVVVINLKSFKDEFNSIKDPSCKSCQYRLTPD